MGKKRLEVAGPAATSYDLLPGFLDVAVATASQHPLGHRRYYRETV
jgi:hypothetical protein